MKIINLQFPNKYSAKKKEFVLAMGYFDGLHLGHRAVIQQAKRIADKQHLKLALLTYSQSPAGFYVNDPVLKVPILPFRQKMQMLEKLGVDTIFLIDYNLAFGSQSPEDYVDNYLAKLGASVVVAGFDHTYGSLKDKADMKHLPRYANGRFEVYTVGECSDYFGKISSTRIRRLLSEGDLQAVNELLGYQFQTVGFVVHGNQIGRRIGFPTANQALEEKQLLPKSGVYAVRTKIVTGPLAGRSFNGMASIGRNETFGSDNPITIEINLFDFSADIYDEEIIVYWIAFLREQVKYADVEALIDQLKQDQVNSLNLLKEIPKSKNYS
ncbi:riboflavin biosynthesis protein RibF [Oenococcus oeni]|uniref:riboflavin biosynthesis protein RibF n=1 Tax=Oenococcus oeni TaxID=1247 RepID=UPI0008F8608F|nr:riboflavin biosynthesis protein RibF [Oenococcus oeni]MDV7687485.1 riboflavin biosynthesis protein RibF [Oenococcus oeni]OIM25972.1 riboflavin biosynthesis protein RibF [Oenococcus oeni]SYW07695.1 Riboflavin biosynthesis protein [Oenococcus oeni]SYW14100.1 Riboflavin biosynthesis protein [Oenococcus oeni]